MELLLISTKSLKELPSLTSVAGDIYMGDAMKDFNFPKLKSAKSVNCDWDAIPLLPELESCEKIVIIVKKDNS